MNPGQVILKRFVIDELLAVGGQATIARGHDLFSNAPVAIKQLNSTPGDPNYQVLHQRFRRCGNLRVGHPNVPDPIACDEEGGQLYLVYPYSPGVDLQMFVRDHGGKLSAQEVIRILLQALSGINALHPKGIVHRDIKPDNLIVRPDGGVDVIDLGICRLLGQPTIAASNGFIGSLAWASPEQLDHADQVDCRSDLYSLAAVGYWMLTGRFVAEGQNEAEMMDCIRNRTPVSTQQLDGAIPVALDQAIMRGLSKNPADRFQNGQEFIAALTQPAQPAAPAASGVCPKCHWVAPGNFCPGCGHDLRNMGRQDDLCLACGASTAHAAKCPRCSRDFTSSNHRLQFIFGALTGKIFRIPQGIFEVGREELGPREYRISRRHMRVASTNGSVVLEDAGSANKTLVDGQEARCPITLQSGMQVVIADNTAIFLSDH